MAVTYGTILVVDDDEDVRAVAIASLHDSGYRAIPASNGDIALTLLQGGLPVDLLFTDIVMPGRYDGFALAFEARRIRPEIRILYTTGFKGFSASMAPIFGRILDKPYRPAQLAGEVMRLLGDDASGSDLRPTARI